MSVGYHGSYVSMYFTMLIRHSHGRPPSLTIASLETQLLKTDREPCEDRCVNTNACWYRYDMFANVPRDILEIVCTFVCQEDVLNMIDASRSLAYACCHWIRRTHTKDHMSIGVFNGKESRN
jgi:hypothetical protein